MAEDVATTVAALEDKRYAAMLSCDTAKLDCLLDDRLSCVYSSGRVDNKASYLSGFGRLWQRRSIDRQDQKIVPLGDTGLVFNTLHINVQVGESLRKVSARALAVWNKSGGAWRLAAVFSATLPGGEALLARSAIIADVSKALAAWRYWPVVCGIAASCRYRVFASAAIGSWTIAPLR
jgi:Domain of unknown function (DUF4440)